MPSARLAALRQAFDAAMKDPALLKEADQAKQDISPTSGVDAQQVANSIVNAPADVIAAAKTILGGK